MKINFKKIKFYNPFKKIRRLEEFVKNLEVQNGMKNERVEALQVMMKIKREMTAEDFIKRIIPNLSWYDYKKLDKQNWLNYYADIQQVLGNEAFNNEVMHFLKDMMEKGFIESEDYGKVLNIRTGFVFIETLMERLKNIEKPDVEAEKVEEPYSAI